MTVDGQPPMVDEQAIIVFLRRLTVPFRPRCTPTSSSGCVGSP